MLAKFKTQRCVGWITQGCAGRISTTGFINGDMYLSVI